MKQRLLLILCLCLLTGNYLSAQVDFDTYTPLKSKGNVPEDFSLETSQKIKRAQSEQRGDLSGKEQKIFVEQVNYTIDGLLKSGLVTYGDEVSLYIQRVGDRLTVSDPELAGKLRFYTMNSNEANAFSTDQGMVFVTTGLIAQMTNEAQLAFVLAHEIVHYQEEHVLDLYDYVMDNKALNYGEKVRFFSKYSRDNELEADKLGVKLLKAAGYSSSEITRTFDILIYSYLPFEEIPFPKDYFNNAQLYVPELAFKGTKREISARQRYDDQLNSHPNVAKRIDALNKEIANFSDWGNVINTPGESFDEIRDICRFEYILNDVYDNRSIDALYEIFIMEQNYPNSQFLNRCKAQIWLEIMKEEKRGYNDYFYYSSNSAYQYQFYEGEISVLGNFFGQLPVEGQVALGLRTIRDLYQKDTTDALIKSMWNRAVELAAYHTGFEPEQFSVRNFQQAIAHFELEKQERLAAKDSIGVQPQRWDKYETIKNTRSGLTVDEGIDSSKFYFYGIADLLNDSLFMSTYKNYKEKEKAEEDEDEAFFVMTDDEQMEYESEESTAELYLGLDTVLLVNPYVVEMRRGQEIDFRKSEELEERLLTVVQEEGIRAGVVVNRLDRSHLTSMTTQQYNDLALIMRTVGKGVETTDPDVFMLDQEWLNNLRESYGTSKVMLLSLEHLHNNHINMVNGIAFTVLFPVGMIYFPIALLTAHTSLLDVYIMDLEKGELVVERSYYSREQVSDKMLASRCYALFNQLIQKPYESD